MYSDDEDDNINYIIDKIDKIEKNITDYLIESTDMFEQITLILNSYKCKIISIQLQVNNSIKLINDLCKNHDELNELAKIKRANIMLFFFRFLYSKGARNLYFAFDDLKEEVNILIDDNIEITKENNEIYGYSKLYDFLIMMKYSLI
jgi:hypothetical protein